MMKFFKKLIEDDNNINEKSFFGLILILSGLIFAIIMASIGKDAATGMGLIYTGLGAFGISAVQTVLAKRKGD